MPPYEFVRNDPIDSVDKDGRQEVFPIPLPPQSPCEKAITDTLHDIGNIRNDKRAHCIHSCQIGKACGKWVCNCLGTLKESRDLTMGGVEWTCSWVLTKSAQDWLHDNIQGGNVDDSAGDFAANDWGMSIAKTGGDCVKECEARYGPEPGE
jgi:hypothetical protein